MQCKVCSRKDAKEINRAILTHGQLRKIARAHGLNVSVVFNHAKKHLPWRHRLSKKEAVTIAEKLADLSFELRRLQVLGECGENVSRAIQAVNARRTLLEFEARLEGKLDPAGKKALLLGHQRQEVPPQKVVFENGRMRTVPDDEGGE
jgi:hypothetical protein